MRKIFSIAAVAVVLALAASGCARERRVDEYQNSTLEKLPFVYKMTVQQGNIVTPEMLRQVEIGMTKRQVRFLLGTPLLIDFFHQDRWDYPYTIKRGHAAMEQRSVTLFFQDDQLVRIAGDILPAAAPATDEAQQVLVTVPDYEGREGLIKRGLKAVGLEPAE